MKLFSCDHCGNTVYFGNVACEQCGHRLGYLPEVNAMVSLDAEGGAWRAPFVPEKLYVFCANADHFACNWIFNFFRSKGLEYLCPFGDS